MSLKEERIRSDYMNKERVRQINKALNYELQYLRRKLYGEINLKTEHKRVKTYKVKQTVEESYLYQLSVDAESPMSYIKNSICNGLTNEIVKDTYFKIEPSTIPYHVDITGIVEVLPYEKEDKE